MRCLAAGCTPPPTGSRRCHCSGCHATFTGLTAFDRHTAAAGCVAPEDVGLVRRPDGMWRCPGENPFAAREETST